MSTQSTAASVRTSIVVNAPVQRAFEVFTQEMRSWWPEDHRVMFTWDISPAWEIETDLERASEVEVRFIAEADSRTRVELEHRNLERHGDGWEGMHGAVGSPGGWPKTLAGFAAHISD